MVMALILGILWTLSELGLTLATGKVTFCYYSSFAQTRTEPGKFLPEDIDPHLCSHIIFAFVDIVGGRKLKPSNWNDILPTEDGLYVRTNALKKINPDLKVLLAVGGWTIGSAPFTPLTASHENQHYFLHYLIHYLRKHGFDGLDMDWEFPGSRGSPPEDKYRFTQLMQAIQDAFYEEALKTRGDKLLLTLAAAAGSHFIEAAYEAEKIVHVVDYILVMTYNYHGSWDDATGHHSALYPHSGDVGKERQLNQMWSLQYYLSVGAPRHKLVVGVATYGMSFTLANRHDHGLKAKAVGGGEPGPYTKESGILAYYEICEMLEEEGWRSVWVEDMKVPYAYRGNQWVGYDDVNSVTFKANNILEMNLGGAFIWSVEMDDFGGRCGGEKYPLLSTIMHIMRPEARGPQSSLQQNHLKYTTVEKEQFIDTPTVAMNFVEDVLDYDFGEEQSESLPVHDFRPKSIRKTNFERKIWDDDFDDAESSAHPTRRRVLVKKRRPFANQQQPPRWKAEETHASPTVRHDIAPLPRVSFIPSDWEIIQAVQKLENEMLPERKQDLGILPEIVSGKSATDLGYYREEPAHQWHESNYRTPEGKTFSKKEFPIVDEYFHGKENPLLFHHENVIDIPEVMRTFPDENSDYFMQPFTRDLQYSHLPEAINTEVTTSPPFTTEASNEKPEMVTTEPITVSPTKAKESVALTCDSAGPIADPTSCKQYYVCIMGAGQRWNTVHMSCHKGYGFHAKQHACMRGHTCGEQ